MSADEKCEVPSLGNDDELARKIVLSYRTVAVVGISEKEDRDSHRVAAYLKNHGFRIVPVNPQRDEVLGEKCYARLAEIPFRVDVVDVFRKPSALPALADEIIAAKPRAAWFQLGVVNNEAAKKIADAGIEVIQNKCIKIEHARYSAEAA
ncbi:MAG: CoA-binding protein [Nitrospinae bacterium]|nr:CoA-binding protein [Nitrospinota bacterium]